MSKDVFISHSTEDKHFADEVCEFLERVGIACWIAPRDVTPGAVFDEAILDAIESTEAMILILSSNANASPFVKNEVNRAFAKGKTIFTFRMQDVLPGKSLEFYLARHHWTDGFPFPLKEKVQRLAVAILALLGKPSPFEPLSPQTELPPGAIGRPATLSPVKPTSAEIETLVASTDAERRLTIQRPQSSGPGISSTKLPVPVTAPMASSEDARVVVKATATHEPPLLGPSTDEAKVAVRQALARIVLEKSTGWGSTVISNDNSARIWPDLARGEMASIVAAILDVLDGPNTSADDRWKAIALLEYAIRTPAGRTAVTHIVEQVARHLADGDLVQDKAKKFVDAAPISAGQKWEFVFPLLPTATGRKLWALIALADKFCPLPERDKLCEAMLDVLEFETNIPSNAYAILSKGKYTKGFGKLQWIACFGDLEKSYYACRLLSELGDVAAGPAIREAITNHRHMDNENVMGLLKSLYLVEKSDAVPFISEVLLNATQKVQASFMYERIGSDEERLREVVKQLMNTTQAEQLHKAGSKYLAKL